MPKASLSQYEFFCERNEVRKDRVVSMSALMEVCADGGGRGGLEVGTGKREIDK
jgi:hypothetical protein